MRHTVNQEFSQASSYASQDSQAEPCVPAPHPWPHPSRVLVPVWPLSPRVLIPASLSPCIPHPRSPHPACPVPRPSPTHSTPRPCPRTPCPVSRSPRLHALSVHVPPAPHCRRAACVQILGQPGATTPNPGRRLTASSLRVHAPLLCEEAGVFQ